MTDVLFCFDIEATPAAVIEALKTTDGIKGFWTSRADVPTEVGATVKVEFAIAPLPFDLRLEQSDERTVVWRTETFPPHWVGTTVRWDVGARRRLDRELPTRGLRRGRRGRPGRLHLGSDHGAAQGVRRDRQIESRVRVA